jgi:hypothetical protein
MLEVLGACAASADGVVSVADLIEQRRVHGAKLPVARASMSRTLRRLWRRELVELSVGAQREETSTLMLTPRAAYRSEPGPHAFALVKADAFAYIYRPGPADPGFTITREDAHAVAQHWRERGASLKAFRETQAFLKAYDLKPYKDRAAFRAAQLKRAERVPVYARWVGITAQGRRLTVERAQHLTGDGGARA